MEKQWVKKMSRRTYHREVYLTEDMVEDTEAEETKVLETVEVEERPRLVEHRGLFSQYLEDDE